MPQQNCWEVRKCGREPGGKNTETLGICPAAACEKLDGINGGKNAGRVCWAVAGTYCDDQIQGTIATKIHSCVTCDFYRVVRLEQQGDFQIYPKSQTREKQP